MDAVAARTDTDPLELPPLFHVIDPDALEASIDGSTRGTLSFQYVGCEVTVHGDETVTVRDVSAGQSTETGASIDD